LIGKYRETLAKYQFFEDSDSDNFSKGADKPDFEFRETQFFILEI
jgi:hypothetical protein